MTTNTISKGFTVKMGSRLGQKAIAVLECLRKHGTKNQLDIEMIISVSALTVTLRNLRDQGYVRKCKLTCCYEITTLGRQAMGESMSLPTPKHTRICNATSTALYDPTRHGLSRIGLAIA